MSTICSPFSSQVITSNFLSVPIVFRQFCTWIAPSNVDLYFLLILVTKASAVKGGTTSAAWLHYQCNQSIQMTNGVAVTSISASLHYKTSVGTDCLYMSNLIKPKIIAYQLFQFTLNWKLSCKFKKWYTFSLRLKQNSAKRNHVKPDLTVLEDSTKTDFREMGFEVMNWMNWLGVGSTGGLLWQWTEQWCDGWKEGHKSRTIFPLSYIYFNLYIVIIHFYVPETKKSAQKTYNNRNNNTQSHNS
jgi:hypothetical protein